MMKRFLKIITCLYAVVAAASALEVKFDGGQSVPSCNYIKFGISTYEDAIKINEVSINYSQLDQLKKKAEKLRILL